MPEARATGENALEIRYTVNKTDSLVKMQARGLFLSAVIRHRWQQDPYFLRPACLSRHIQYDEEDYFVKSPSNATNIV